MHFSWRQLMTSNNLWPLWNWPRSYTAANNCPLNPWLLSATGDRPLVVQFAANCAKDLADATEIIAPWVTIQINDTSGFSPGLNDRVQHPVILFDALSFCSVPCRFFSALSFFESPLVSSGFHQRYFELEVAESVQLRRKVARFSCITLLFASDIAASLDLHHRFGHESEATLMAFEGMSFSQLFTWKVCGDLWILIRCNEY